MTKKLGEIFIPVFVTGLQRVENPQDLSGVTASRGGIGEN